MNQSPRILITILSIILLIQGCNATTSKTRMNNEVPPDVRPGEVLRKILIHPACEGGIPGLDPENISERDVQEVLRHCPAPRIFNFNGSLAPVSMNEFSKFLIQMGYPRESLVNTENETLSFSSFDDSQKYAGLIAWYYEHQALRPMLIGHSQGGMMVIKILHELNGAFNVYVPVWNPEMRFREMRYQIMDPYKHELRDVVGLRVPFAAALATGRLMRVLLGQWNMLGKIREIPSTVDEFVGFTIPGDVIGSDLLGMGDSHRYRSKGAENVRNIDLPASYNHVNLPDTTGLSKDVLTKMWMNAYKPGSDQPTPPKDEDIVKDNLIHAAELWYAVKKHWCLEVQNLVRHKKNHVSQI